MWPKGDSSTVTPSVRGAGHWGAQTEGGVGQAQVQDAPAVWLRCLAGCRAVRVAGWGGWGAFCSLQVLFSEAPCCSDARWVPHTPGRCDPGKVSGLGAPEGFRRH